MLGLLQGFKNMLTALAGVAVAVGSGMEAAGMEEGRFIMAGATAYGLMAAKDAG